MNKKLFLAVCVLVIFFTVSFSAESQAVVNLPLTLTYDLPLEFRTSSAAAVFRRLDIDVTLQILGEASPVISIGGEFGISTTLPAVVSAATAGFLPLGLAISNDYTSFGSTLVGHFPFRFLINFKANDQIDFDLYSGVQFNLVDNSVHPHYDMTLDVGARMNVYDFIIHVSYALPVSVDFRSTPATTGFWSNSITVGLGYRFRISG